MTGTLKSANPGGTAIELAQRISSKSVSAVEVVEQTLERIDRLGEQLNCYTHVCRELARREAAACDEELSRGQLRGPLHGVPFSVKDTIDVAGVPTTLGASSLKQWLPPETATVVQKIRDAGGILVGKSNVPLLLMLGETVNEAYGRTVNPHNADRICGGSSGGEAAAVAGGLVPFGIASDLGGSIHTPAHACGLVGMRPTVGRLSTLGLRITDSGRALATGLSSRCTTAGPLCHSVEDAALLVSLMSGVDGKDPFVVPEQFSGIARVRPEELNICVYHDNGSGVSCSGEVRDAIERTAALLQEQGVHVDRRVPAGVAHAFRRQCGLFGAGGSEALRDEIARLEPQGPSAQIQANIEIFDRYACDTATFIGRLAEWDAYRSEMLAFVSEYDVIVSPVMPTSAMPHGQTVDRLEEYGYIWAYTSLGWPSVSLPMGVDSEGVPVSVLISAAPWNDSMALGVAALLETCR